MLRPGGAAFTAELHPYRQLTGRGLELPDAPGTGVEAYTHSVSEYVNAALASGLIPRSLGEWRDERDVASDAAPRLFTMLLAG